MSYVGIGFGDHPECEHYIVRGDGRCKDAGGIKSGSWYDIDTARCVSPPPINCDVNAVNLPAAAPAARAPAPTPAPSNGAAETGVSTGVLAVAIIAGLGLVYIMGQRG